MPLIMPPISQPIAPNHSPPPPPACNSAFVRPDFLPLPLHPPQLLAPRAASPLPEREPPPPAGRVGRPRSHPSSPAPPPPGARRSAARRPLRALHPLLAAPRARGAAEAAASPRAAAPTRARPSGGRPREARGAAPTPRRGRPDALAQPGPGGGFAHVQSPRRPLGRGGVGVPRGERPRGRGSPGVTGASPRLMGLTRGPRREGSPAAKSQEREREGASGGRPRAQSPARRAAAPPPAVGEGPRAGGTACPRGACPAGLSVRRELGPGAARCWSPTESAGNSVTPGQLDPPIHTHKAIGRLEGVHLPRPDPRCLGLT